jgi:hypothetical protein
MINANELMVDNWVEYKGKYYQVAKIDAENTHSDLGYVGSVSLKQTKENPLPSSPWCALINPISVTEDTLLRIGFTSYEKKLYLPIAGHGTVERAIWYTENKLWLSDFDTSNNDRDVVLLTIQPHPPIHIIQNIYSLLTAH